PALPCDHILSPARATPALYTLSLHDALPICLVEVRPLQGSSGGPKVVLRAHTLDAAVDPQTDWQQQPQDQEDKYWMPPEIQYLSDRKSTRLNSSHGSISYAVFCLKKKKKK